MVMSPADEGPAWTSDVPDVPILLLGDSGIGKSTFLSRLTLGDRGHDTQGNLPLLRDLDQPFPFDIRLYGRKYRLEFSDTASPENYTLLKPAVIILCFSIADPASLQSLKTRWKDIVEGHFNYDEALPVIVLGLKRDAREKSDYDGKVKQAAGSLKNGGEEQSEVLQGRTIVYPQEGLVIAQEMRCDRYCECSALTGELCREVFEDITKTAAKTTTTLGGRTQGTDCSIM